MQSTPMPEAAPAPLSVVADPDAGRERRRGNPLGALFGALRGDKYMADAYPPRWKGRSGPPVVPAAGPQPAEEA